MKENKTRERRRAPSAESSFSPRNYAEIHRGSFEFDGVKVIIAENTGEGAPSILALTRNVVHLTSMHMAVEASKVSTDPERGERVEKIAPPKLIRRVENGSSAVGRKREIAPVTIRDSFFGKERRRRWRCARTVRQDQRLWFPGLRQACHCISNVIWHPKIFLKWVSIVPNPGFWRY